MLGPILAAKFQQEELLGCFQGSASVIYYAELEEAVVTFTPLNNSVCVLGNTVQLQLDFDNIDPQIYVYSGYEHGTTTQIIMRHVLLQDNAGNSVTPKYAVLNISTLSHHAILRVKSIWIQRSALDQCFAPGLDVFQFDEQEIRFSLQVTNACMNDITFIKNVELALGKSIMIFNVDFSISKEDNCEIISVAEAMILRCHTLGNFSGEMQTAFVTASVDFALEVFSNNYAISHTFPRVQVGALPNIFKDEYILFMYESAVFVSIEYDPVFLQELVQLIEQQDYNKIIYRISFKHRFFDINFTMQYISGIFNPLQQQFLFACEDQYCKDMLAYLVHEELEDLNGAFDIAFYHNSVFVQIVSKIMLVRHSCNRRIIGYLTQLKQLNLYMFEDVKHGCPINKSEPFTSEFYIFSYGIEKPIDAVLSFDKNNTVKFINATEKEIKSLLKSGTMAIIVKENDERDIMVVDTVAYAMYSTVSFVTCSLGTIILSLFIAASILHVIMFMKVIRSASKRQK